MYSSRNLRQVTLTTSQRFVSAVQRCYVTWSVKKWFGKLECMLTKAELLTDECSLYAGKKSKKKPPPPPPPVGAWIHKLHLADNGIDARGEGNTLDLPGQSGTVVLHDCLQMFAQWVLAILGPNNLRDISLPTLSELKWGETQLVDRL